MRGEQRSNLTMREGSWISKSLLNSIKTCTKRKSKVQRQARDRTTLASRYLLSKWRILIWRQYSEIRSFNSRSKSHTVRVKLTRLFNLWILAWNKGVNNHLLRKTLSRSLKIRTPIRVRGKEVFLSLLTRKGIQLITRMLTLHRRSMSYLTLLKTWLIIRGNFKRNYRKIRSR